MSLEDDVLAAYAALIDPQHPINQPHPCALGQHVVSSVAKARGYGICVNCGMPVGDWAKGRAEAGCKQDAA